MCMLDDMFLLFLEMQQGRTAGQQDRTAGQDSRTAGQEDDSMAME